MKKIAFLINSFSSGGAEKVLSQIATELNTNNNIYVIMLENNNFYKVNNLNTVYLSNDNGQENGIIKLFKIPLLAYRLIKFIKKNDIDIVQSHIFRANYINLFAKVLGSTHEVQIVNTVSISAKYLKNELKNKINLMLIKYLYKYADKIICKSKEMMVDLKKYSKVNSEYVIYNPYNIDNIKLLSNERVDDFNFNKNQKYLITVGRLHKDKNQKFLIEAMKSLTDYHLLIIGEGTCKHGLLEYSTSLKVDERVHFLGRKVNPYKYISKSDFFVSASLAEGFPNVLVEAMICKTPVIFSDCQTGPREILAPKTNFINKLKNGYSIEEFGILFSSNDLKSFIDSINFLNNNLELIEKLKVDGFHRAYDFSLDKIINQYKKVLEIE